MWVLLILSVTDYSAFVSLAIVLIFWLMFLSSFEIPKMAPMKKLNSLKASIGVVRGVFWLSR